QLLAPRRLGRAIGVGDSPILMRLLGLRELASGLGILTQRNPSTWLQARVVGDAMDLALLGSALSSKDADAGRVLAATAAVGGVAALDVRCCREFRSNPGANIRAIHLKRVITINRSVEELFQFWRNFENLPRFMNHLESVRVINDRQ